MGGGGGGTPPKREIAVFGLFPPQNSRLIVIKARPHVEELRNCVTQEERDCSDSTRDIYMGVQDLNLGGAVRIDNL